MWPAMIPDAVGLMVNDAGILPADARREQYQDDGAGSAADPPTVSPLSSSTSPPAD
jgi:hypothetical protein